MTAAADRHLLFGLLALQNGLIDQVELVPPSRPGPATRPGAWPTNSSPAATSTPTPAPASKLIVALHVKKHGDVERSLAAIPPTDPPAPAWPRWRARDRGHARPGRSGPDGHATEADDDTTPTAPAAPAVGGATGDGQRFRFLRPHARGGLGEVFVALDGELHREVALKQILEKHADDPVSRQRFVLEAEMTGGLEHPGIVPVYGLGTYGERPAVLRHAVHQGRQPQGGDRALPR